MMMLTEDRKYCKVFREVLNEYLDRDWMIPIKSYLNLSDQDKAYDCAGNFPWLLSMYIHKPEVYDIIEKLIADNKLPNDVLSWDDYEMCEEIGPLFNNELADYAEDFIKFVGRYDNIDIPLYLVADYEGLIKNQWLIHMTDSSNVPGIWREGFSVGVDIDQTAYTPARGTTDFKYGAGYNFAFLADEASHAEGTYGDCCILFQASGIRIYHYGDEEYQVIFYGPSAKNLILIEQTYDHDWLVRDDNSGQELYRNERLQPVVDWCINNMPQYRKKLFGKVNPRVRYERNINKRKEREKNGTDNSQYGYVGESKKHRPLVNEGYASAKYSKVISRFADQIVDMSEALKSGDIRGWKPTGQNTYQSKLNLPLPNEKSVEIILNFFADNNKKGNPSGGYDHSDDTIKLYLTPTNVSYDRLYNILSHELTHKLDYDRLLDMDENGNAYVSHHFVVPKEKLPTCIRKVLYILWDTTEFNAWQSSYDMINTNGLIGLKALKYYIGQCNSINDPAIWTTVGEVLSETSEIEKQVWNVNNKYADKSPQWIKKYFMRVSVDKYKKFVKKVVRWKGRNNVDYI